MATHFDEAEQIVISEEAARGGVVGHNVRYVLAFGLTGVIVAFAVLALYWGYDNLAQRAATAFSASPSEWFRSFAPYAGIIVVGAIGLGLLLGAWNIVAGRTTNASQQFMRLRVAAQFTIICVILAILAMSTG